MKKALSVGFLILLFSLGLSGQGLELVMNMKSNYGPGTATTKIETLTGGNWDDGYFDVTLPATMKFYFYGKLATHVRIWTNGYITLGFGAPPTDAVDYSNDPMPDSTTPNAYIAPWWSDWDLQSKGEMYYTVYPDALVVSWVDIAHINDPTSSYDFKAGIYSSTMSLVPNMVLFSYQDVDSGTGTYDRGAYATIGIEHYTGWQCQKLSYNTQVIQNAMWVSFTPYVPIYDSTDFWETDGGKPDILLFREDIGLWYKRSNDGVYTHDLAWGTLGDVALPGDYDGDGDADETVVRPGTYYLWFGTSPTFTEVWGVPGDIPIASDFNGDGVTDLCVFRPTTGIWYIKYRTLASDTSFQWGAPGDIPIPADYDGDGNADAAVFRPSTNQVYIRRSSNPASPWIRSFGQEGDVFFPFTDTYMYPSVGLYRPSTGQWFELVPSTGTINYLSSWGTESDVPVPNDWNAGSVTDETIWRPSDGLWYVQGWTTLQYGYRGDKPRCRRSFQIVAPPAQGGQTPGENGN